MALTSRLRVHEVRESPGLAQAQVAHGWGVSRAMADASANQDVGGIEVEPGEALGDALGVGPASLLVFEREAAGRAR